MKTKALQKAVQLAKNGQFEQAREICLKLCGKNSKNTEAWQMLGAIHEALGDYSAAAKCFENILSRTPGNPELLCKLGVVLQKQGKVEEAVQFYRKSLKIRPDYFDARYYLGNTLYKTGSFDEAHSLFKELLRYKRNTPEIHANIANIFYEKNECADALSHCNEAIRLKPSFEDAICLKGRILTGLNRFEEAVEAYQHVLKSNTRSTLALKGLSRAYREQGDYSLALDRLKQALDIDPVDIVSLLNQGDLLMVLSRPNDAFQYYERVLKLQADNLSALCGLGESYFGRGIEESGRYYTLALKIDSEHERAIAGFSEVLIAKGEYEKAKNLLGAPIDKGSLHHGIIRAYAEVCNHFGEDGKAILLLTRYLDHSSDAVAQRSQVHFRLGKLLDARKEYNEAFNHFEKANNLSLKTVDPDLEIDVIDKMKVVFSSEHINTLPRTKIKSELPVFIVGMPRSGTSLVEQILDSHAMIYGAGERTDIPNAYHLLLRADSVPDTRHKLDAALLNKLALEYLTELSILSGDSLRVTDKLPHNFLFIGLIELMFPRARVIHCNRNGLDTCLSIFFQNMASSHAYSTDLNNLGKYYCKYLGIMEHWKQVSHMSILDVNYEELVNDQEAVSRRIVEFCALDWDENCLNFHSNKRVVATFSHSQVRQPMYNKSINRWQNYEEHLDVLRAALIGK